MNRAQFEHAIRAAGAILGESEVLVIGSQAIHASLDGDTLPEAERSIEVDVSSLELSMFQDTFGYYAQGVTPASAVLPSGWRKRLVPYCTPATGGVTALCLEPHDLWLSKAIAGPEKYREFCRARLERAIVSPTVLRQRLDQVPDLKPAVRERVGGLIAAA